MNHYLQELWITFSQVIKETRQIQGHRGWKRWKTWQQETRISRGAGKNPRDRSCGNHNKVHQQLWSFLQKCWKQKTEVESPRTERIPRYFAERPMCWTINLLKLNNPTVGNMTTVMDILVNYERRIRLAKKPWEGPLSKVQDRYLDHPIEASTGDNKYMSVWTQINLR